MNDSKPSLPVWPFLVVDALLVWLALFLLQQAHKPLLWWESVLLIICVAAAAVCFMFPFTRRNKDEQSLAQARLATDALNQIQKIDQVAAQIAGATTQWGAFQQQAGEITNASKVLAGSISAESKAFTEFLQKANESEKSHLRLELEKLRRGEREWLQVLIHILDHVSALLHAAHQSGQPNYIEQIGQFHNSCRETARRIGLVPVASLDGAPFDPNQHQLRDKTVPEENAIVGETLAPGYTFQGQLVRRALVSLKEQADPAMAERGD